MGQCHDGDLWIDAQARWKNTRITDEKIVETEYFKLAVYHTRRRIITHYISSLRMTRTGRYVPGSFHILSDPFFQIRNIAVFIIIKSIRHDACGSAIQIYF